MFSRDIPVLSFELVFAQYTGLEVFGSERQGELGSRTYVTNTGVVVEMVAM